MKLAHARPGDTLERRDGADWIVIRIDAAFAETLPSGEPARFVDFTDEQGASAQRIRADTDPHDWRRVDHEADARAGFAALAGAGSVPPAPPPLDGRTDDRRGGGCARREDDQPDTRRRSAAAARRIRSRGRRGCSPAAGAGAVTARDLAVPDDQEWLPGYSREEYPGSFMCYCRELPNGETEAVALAIEGSIRATGRTRGEAVSALGRMIDQYDREE